MQFEKVKFIRSVGRRKAYDLSLKGKWKGYLVNGTQTHNSGGDMRADLTIEDTVTLFENSKEFATKYPHVISTAKKLEGIVKGRGVHAAGLVVDTSDLFSGEKCVLLRDKDGDLVVNWDKKDLEYMGMMKLDVLGLKTLNILHRIHDLVLERHKTDIDWKAISLNGDKAVYDAFCAGEAIGVFQFGTAGMQQYLRQFKPHNFEDLVQVNALWRPGTLRCVIGDTKIYTTRGWKRIDSVEAGGPAISSEYPESRSRKYVKNHVRRVFSNGVRPVYKLHDSDGNEICCTKQHKFFTKKGWRELDALGVGEEVLVIEKLANFQKKINVKNLVVYGAGTRFQKGAVPWNKNKPVAEWCPSQIYKIEAGTSIFPPRTLAGEIKRKEAARGEESIHKMKQTKNKFWLNPKEHQKHSRTMKKYYQEHSHPNEKGINVSKPQREIFEEIRQWFPDAVLNHRLVAGDTCYSLDIAIPSKKLDVEFDGDYWHAFPGARTEPRDSDIEKVGWKVRRLTYETYRGFVQGLSEMKIDNSTKWSKIRSIKYAGRKPVYDLEMRSRKCPNYIANRFVVHNSGMVSEFIEYRIGKKKPSYINQTLKDILKETYGIVLYQEQIMYILNQIGNIPWRTADIIRKVVSKSEGQEKFESFRKEFIEGVRDLKSMPVADAEKIFSLMKFHGSYSFNKCIAGDSTVLIPYGKWRKNVKKRITIAEAYEQNIKQIYIHHEGKSILAPVKEIVKTGEKKVYELVCRTNRARRIKATPDHKFMTPTGWRRLGDLVVGDEVLVKKSSMLMLGKDNPGFGRIPWNKDKKYSTGPRGEISEFHRAALSKAARVRKVHGHTGHKHSEFSKELCRAATLGRIAKGEFPQTDTSIHKAVVEGMKKESLWEGFVSEYAIGYFSVDIANPEKRIAIEVQGDYWHANPTIRFGEGKLSYLQSRNVERDKVKKKFLEDKGWVVLELWEKDIKENLFGCIQKIDGLVSEFSDNPWEYAKIENIFPEGVCETYDIHVDHSAHNYIANMFVVHNSHSVEYSTLGFWTMWAKIHYPEEFYCASLCRGDDEDLSQLLGDASRRGFSLQNPDINFSSSSWTIEGGKTLRAGFDAIKGISLTTSEAIVAARIAAGGKFKSFEQFYEAVPKRSVNILKVRQLLLAGAFDGLLSKVKRNKMYLFIEREKWVSSDDTELAAVTDSDAEALQVDLNDVFNYELSSNYYQYHRRLIELLSGKLTVVKLDILKGTSREQRGQEAEVRYFIGKFDSIKYGYRAKVEKVGQVESKGFSSDLGGVYGILRDDTWSSYASFSGKLYRRPEIKGRVEECAGKYMLLRTDSLPWGVANIFIQDLFFMEDIKSGILASTLDLRGVLKEADNGVCLELAEELKRCTACQGRAACRRPTPFSTGLLNVMVVGEAPGGEEEESGIPFVGKAGKILWQSLERYKLCREMFHVTNILKCRPKDNKIADAQPAVDVCREVWLAAEIEAVCPRLILSLGKTATQTLSGDPKASIMEKTGTTEWSERYGCWIVYGIHPASVLYSSENKVQLDRAVDVFAGLVERLL